LARFDRQEEAGDRLADTLGDATEQLRVALEREAVDIISKAREQAASLEEAARLEAASIEQAARQRADKLEREARVRAEAASARAEEARASQSKRIAGVLKDVEDLEQRMLATVADLRRRLSSETEDEPVAVPEPAAENGAPQFSRPVPMSVAAQVGAATEPNPVLDDMMRAQIVNMAGSGTPRAEAERFLGRFKLGESYLGMLDEVYSEHDGTGAPAGDQSKRRRLRRRGT
jgi:hypothetical protein